jgi:ATP-dependent DNA helicase RecQ
VNLSHGQVEQVLKFLSVDSPAPIIKDGSRWKRTPIPYRMDHERIRRLTAQRETEWDEIQGYLSAPGCLMEYLADSLDDENAERCGKCSNCLGKPIVDPSFSRSQAIDALCFLRHSESPLKCNKQVARDAFVEYGLQGNIPQNLRAETGRVLSRWGDAGWGQFVADDKHSGRFRDELVEAVAEMLTARWKPNPGPEWVTCVPSRNHPTLVPDFAARLAKRLGIPFIASVTKVRVNEPQKAQQNRFHQCRNLDGVFAITGTISPGPVLLVDDVIDSGWTMTIIAALLRRSGSGVVWPVALATSSVGG